MKQLFLFLSIAAVVAVVGATPASAQTSRFDRSGTWSGELGVGGFFIQNALGENEAGISVNGQARYHFTRNFALGPSGSVGFTENYRVYNIRALARIGAVIAEKSRSPLELYAEVGVGTIIFDNDDLRAIVPPTTVPIVVERADTKADLVIPFGGGFVWHVAPGFGIHGGALMNVTTNDDDRFYPEFFAGLIF